MSSDQTPRAAVPVINADGRDGYLIDNETGGGIEARVRAAVNHDPTADRVLRALGIPATTTTTEDGR